MSIATATANTFDLDIRLMIKSSNGTVLIIANDIDFIGIGLSLLNWLLGAVLAVLNFALGWLDIPPHKRSVIAIWLNEILKGMREELCNLNPFSLKETSPWV